MEILARRYPLLAGELNKAKNEMAGDDLHDLQIETASSGAPTLVFSGRYVHSKRDPEKEALRLVESAVRGDENSDVPALILGFGLGYAASALAAKPGGRPIIVVEKRAEILSKALEIRDLSSLLSRERLVFVLGGSGEGVTGALSLFESSPGVPPAIIQNRALTGIDEEWYAGVEERIKAWNSRTNVNRATQKRFGKRWVRNLSQNLAAIRDIPGISRLEGILGNRGGEKDIPVFLAAAGPTLDTTGPLLGEIQKRCVIVAADTSLRFLLARRIDPDFVVSVDPQYWNYRHLDRVPAPKTCLIAESAVYPPVLRHSFGAIFFCSSFFPLGRFIEDRVEPKGKLGAGGSVATSAWDFARLLGARQLWIAGLDLSFPRLRTHFRGAVFEEKSHTESGRFAPVETWNFRALRDGQPFLAKRQGGASVLTDKRLSLYASWFESRFSQYPEIKNYSLSAEGLAIPGLQTAAPEELLSLPGRREEINLLLGETYAAVERDFASEAAKADRAGKYESARTMLLKGLWEIKELAEDAAAGAAIAANRARQGRPGKEEQERALKKLDNANMNIAKSAVKEIAGFLFPETTEWDAEIAATTADPLIMHLEFSARFYRALGEAAEFTCKNINLD